MQKHLLDEEGVSLCLVVDEGDELGGRRLTRAAREQECDIGLRQSREANLGREPVACQLLPGPGEPMPRADVTGPVAPDEQQRELAGDLRQRGDQQQARLVRPVQILEAQHEWPAERGAFDEAAEAVQQVLALLIWRDGG